MNNLDLNFIFLIATIVFGTVSVASGFWMVARSFISFREQINQSLNMDLEIIRVSKAVKPRDENARQDSWKEEIGAMEQLLTAISTIKDKKDLLSRLMYDSPIVSLEISNSSSDDEIIFFVAMPKKFRETIEKQIHSFFPNASMEKAPDYTIFTSGSFTAAASLQLKSSYILPIKTYEGLEIDPLNSLANALSKLETLGEGAAIQLVLRPASVGWRSAGRKVAHKMQQGKQLKDVHNKSVIGIIGTGAGDMVHGALNSKKKDGTPLDSGSETIQLTPEEQELLKGIEQKNIVLDLTSKLNLKDLFYLMKHSDLIRNHEYGSLERFQRNYEPHRVIQHKLVRGNQHQLLD